MALPPPVVDRAVRWLVVAAVVLLSVRVLGQGFLPPDDALRHAAKAVSGRPWSDILVMRPTTTPDGHPGWHFVLGAVHRSTGAGAPALVLFSVVGLFVLFAL